MRRNAGFTLLELVLVLVLLGTLSAIFAAHFPRLNFTFESEFMECESRLREAVVFARNQQLMYHLNWYGHVRRGVSPLRQLNQGAHSGIVS